MASHHSDSVPARFPLLQKLGYGLNITEVVGFSVAGIVNTLAGSRYTLHKLEVGDQLVELTVVGLGDSAFFQWTNQQGQAVSDAFQRLTAGELDRVKAIIAHS